MSWHMLSCVLLALALTTAPPVAAIAGSEKRKGLLEDASRATRYQKHAPRCAGADRASILPSMTLPTGQKVVVSAFGESPLDAMDHHLSILPMDPPDPASLSPRDILVEVKSASVG